MTRREFVGVVGRVCEKALWWGPYLVVLATLLAREATPPEGPSIFRGARPKSTRSISDDCVSNPCDSMDCPRCARDPALGSSRIDHGDLSDPRPEAFRGMRKFTEPTRDAPSHGGDESVGPNLLPAERSIAR